MLEDAWEYDMLTCFRVLAFPNSPLRVMLSVYF